MTTISDADDTNRVDALTGEPDDGPMAVLLSRNPLVALEQQGTGATNMNAGSRSMSRAVVASTNVEVQL
jgi:hypothetical protein